MIGGSYLSKLLALFFLIVASNLYASTTDRDCKHHSHKKNTLKLAHHLEKKTHAHPKKTRHVEQCKIVSHRHEHTKKAPYTSKWKKVDHRSIPHKVKVTSNPHLIKTIKPVASDNIHHHNVSSVHSYRAHPVYKDIVFKDVVPCCLPKCLRDGFYVGLAGGFDSYRIRREQNEVIPLTSDRVSNPALSAVGTVGGLYAGYGKYFKQLYYLGAEVFGTTTGASTGYSTNSNALFGELIDSSQTQINVNSNFGISLLPGFKLNDSSLIYLRWGYSKLSIRTSSMQSFPDRFVGANGRTSWTNGIAYGIGLETAIYANWSLRGEYTHTEYSSITAPDTILHGVPGSGNTDTPVAGNRFFPSNNQFMLGLSYHIG